MFILGLIYAALLLADKCAGPDSDPPFLAAVPVGLMTASLISLKATFIPFSLLFGGLIFLAFLVLAGNRKQMAFVGGIAIGTASLVLVPWVLISHNNYGRIFVDALGNGAQRGIEGRGSLGNLEWFSELFFSQGILKYGGTILDYNFTIFTLMAAVLISLYLLFRNRERLNRMYIAVGLCAFVATIAVYLVNGHITRYLDDTVRYTAPVIVAVIPASVLILARGFWRFSNVTAGRFAPALPITTVLVALQIMVAGMFADVFLSRIIIAKNYGMALPYLFKPFIGFNRFALNDDVRPLIRKIQSKTIEGSKILVWVSLPFQFDFKRNQILNIEAAELVVDRIEGERNPEKLRKVLKAIGVRYVLWQSTGMGMERESSLREDSQIPILRKESISKLELRGLLRSLENSSKIILRTAEWTLYDIAKK